jgi:hypothetical protein
MFKDQGEQTTLVTFLLDRTGSMQAIKADTIGGFNAYLDTLEREAGDLVEFTMLQFDSQSIDTLHAGTRLSNVPRLTDETYQPRASTPLIDACFEAIKATEELVARRQDRSRVVVVFQTDGEENASRRRQLADLVDLIKRRSDEGWKFVFLGANIDAYRTARAFGIADGATVAYDARLSGTAMEEAAVLTADVAMGLAEELFFSTRSKRAAGDRFDPDAAAAATESGDAE